MGLISGVIYLTPLILNIKKKQKRILTTMKKLLLILLVTLSYQYQLFAQVAINTTSSSAHSSAMLDVSSTSRGALFPRMTSSQRQAISNPARGLLVFDTTIGSIYYYTGSEWIVLSSGQLWNNSSNNTYLAVGNKLGINTNNPQRQLHVVGDATLSSVLIAPNEPSTNSDSELSFAEDDDGTYGISLKYVGSENTLHFYGNSFGQVLGPHLSIQRDGNIGIGIGSPTERLHVVGTGNNISALFVNDGNESVLRIQQNGTGAAIKLYNADLGGRKLEIGNDGTMDFYNDGGHNTVTIDPSEIGSSDAGQITLYNSDGTQATIELDGGYANGPRGRITTNELEITGGSDLSEYFEVSEERVIKKGMLMSLDADNPGKLTISRKAYDKKVAGIVSGANDINTGLIMSQKGSMADGEHLIALTGRVYCFVDATKNPIEVGDLLTTSNTEGHAMKAINKTKMTGAIIGKAMSPLKSGKGLVLVLVNLQ